MTPIRTGLTTSVRRTGRREYENLKGNGDEMKRTARLKVGD
jgi:hypothetical protein